MEDKSSSPKVDSYGHIKDPFAKKLLGLSGSISKDQAGRMLESVRKSRESWDRGMRDVKVTRE